MVDFLWENLFRTSRLERTVAQKLRENILFKNLSFFDLNLVEKIIHLRTYKPGEIVFRQGEVGAGMYIIAKGKVNISREEVVPKTGEVESTLVTQLREGDFFGDLALVEEDSKRSATAVANEESQLIGFFKSDLLEIAERNPSAGVKVLINLGHVLGARLRETTSKITELKKERKQV